jgi:hypothetical protein
MFQCFNKIPMLGPSNAIDFHHINFLAGAIVHHRPPEPNSHNQAQYASAINFGRYPPILLGATLPRTRRMCGGILGRTIPLSKAVLNMRIYSARRIARTHPL